MLQNLGSPLSREQMKILMGGQVNLGSNCGTACDQQAYCCATQKKDTCCNLVRAGCSFIVGIDGQGCN